MEANTPFPKSFAKNPMQEHGLEDAIAAALLQFDRSMLLVRDQPSQIVRMQIAILDSTD